MILPVSTRIPVVMVVLQEGVQPAVIDSAGWALLLGGIALTLLWWRALYR